MAHHTPPETTLALPVTALTLHNHPFHTAAFAVVVKGATLGEGILESDTRR